MTHHRRQSASLALTNSYLVQLSSNSSHHSESSVINVMANSALCQFKEDMIPGEEFYLLTYPSSNITMNKFGDIFPFRFGADLESLEDGQDPVFRNRLFDDAARALRSDASDKSCFLLVCPSFSHVVKHAREWEASTERGCNERDKGNPAYADFDQTGRAKISRVFCDPEWLSNTTVLNLAIRGRITKGHNRHQARGVCKYHESSLDGSLVFSNALYPRCINSGDAHPHRYWSRMFVPLVYNLNVLG